MTKTLISDIVVPEIYNPYLLERTAALSALFQSGLVERSPYYDQFLIGSGGGGKTFNIPFFQDFNVADEVLSDTSALAVNAVSAAKDTVVRLSRGIGVSVNDVAKHLAGADPMMSIANGRAEYWNRRFNTIAINTLMGAIIGTNMTDHIHDISGSSGAAANFTASTFIDACAKLGDNSGKLSIIVMHSAVYAKLQKDQLIAYLPTANVNIIMPTYLGKKVVVDDSCPVPSSGIYMSFICGEGAIAFGTSGISVETDRDVLARDTIMSEAWELVMHPKGVAFISGSVAADSPTNAELALAANWSRVAESKNIAIVGFKTKLYNT
jgi:hypothetical protein